MAKSKHPRNNPTKALRTIAETRRYEMLELTKAGRTEREIAEELGVARSLVNRDVKRVLGELAQSATRTADTVRALQMERYVALLARWWERAMDADAEATTMVLRIMRQIDVINGIIPDRPLIDMSINQTVQVGAGMGLMELARYMANGNGTNGVSATSPADNGQPVPLSDGRSGSETVSEAD